MPVVFLKLDFQKMLLFNYKKSLLTTRDMRATNTTSLLQGPNDFTQLNYTGKLSSIPRNQMISTYTPDWYMLVCSNCYNLLIKGAGRWFGLVRGFGFMNFFWLRAERDDKRIFYPKIEALFRSKLPNQLFGLFLFLFSPNWLVQFQRLIFDEKCVLVTTV